MSIIGAKETFLCDGSGGHEVDFDYTIDRTFTLEDDPVQEDVNFRWTVITDGEHETGFWVPYFPDQPPEPTIILGPEVESAPE